MSFTFKVGSVLSLIVLGLLAFSVDGINLSPNSMTRVDSENSVTYYMLDLSAWEFNQLAVTVVSIRMRNSEIYISTESEFPSEDSKNVVVSKGEAGSESNKAFVWKHDFSPLNSTVYYIGVKLNSWTEEYSHYIDVAVYDNSPHPGNSGLLKELQPQIDEFEAQKENNGSNIAQNITVEFDQATDRFEDGTLEYKVFYTHKSTDEDLARMNRIELFNDDVVEACEWKTASEFEKGNNDRLKIDIPANPEDFTTVNVAVRNTVGDQEPILYASYTSWTGDLGWNGDDIFGFILMLFCCFLLCACVIIGGAVAIALVLVCGGCVAVNTVLRFLMRRPRVPESYGPVVDSATLDPNLVGIQEGSVNPGYSNATPVTAMPAEAAPYVPSAASEYVV